MIVLLTVVLRGLKGEIRPYNGAEYFYNDAAKCIVEEENGTKFAQKIVDYCISKGCKFHTPPKE